MICNHLAARQGGDSVVLQPRADGRDQPRKPHEIHLQANGDPICGS
jgi:hypothetical protein